MDRAKQGLTLVSEAELEPGEDAPMTIAVNPKASPQLVPYTSILAVKY